MTTISASTSTTPVLITDTFNAPNGSCDAIQSMTIVNGQPVSAALEIQSTTGGLLVPRMSTAEIDDLNADNGMIAYDEEVEKFKFHEGGSWQVNSGDMSGPGASVVDNIATFADITGKLLKDSGVNIGEIPPALNPSILAPGNDITISNLSYLQFYQNAGYSFIGTQAGVQLYQVAPDESTTAQRICVLITDGDIPPEGPASVSCPLEINAQRGI